MTDLPEPRRYHILGLLGSGGFGRVYRARLEGPDGFTKEVAIKLLHDYVEDQRDTLRRFRDEARILGLVRDRAIVSVEPPIRLEGRWAVVMEYVGGMSAEELLEDHGVLPGSVAVEIVAELARALHKVWNLPGPDGQPLHLVHRDIKPSNIKITSDGEIKLLDFGLARARFAHRESQTTAHIGGTFGYIAPERIEGRELQAGDIFSLGVVLHRLVTGELPSLGQRVMSKVPSVAQGLLLAQQMRSVRPASRPSAREVERRCQELRRILEGPSLRDWAETHVRERVLAPDEHTGHRLTESSASFSASTQAVTHSKRRLGLWARLALTLGGTGVLVAMLAGLGVLGAVGAWLIAASLDTASTADSTRAEPVGVQAPMSREEVSSQAPVESTPESSARTVPRVAAPAAPAPPRASKEPLPTDLSEPVRQEVEIVHEPPLLHPWKSGPDEASGPVMIVFPGRDGYSLEVDGESRGTLPVRANLTPGEHLFTVRGDAGTYTVTQRVVFGDGTPVINLAE